MNTAQQFVVNTVKQFLNTSGLPLLPSNYKKLEEDRAYDIDEMFISGVMIMRPPIATDRNKRLDLLVSHPSDDYTKIHVVADMALACGWHYQECINQTEKSAYMIFVR